MTDRNAPRLFVDAALPGALTLTANQANYLRNVLRKSPGDAILVFNGQDGEYAASITSLGKRGGEAHTTDKVRGQTEPLQLTLAFAPLRQARLDYMMEKAAEMGARAVVPVLTQHGQVRRINADRLRANMIEACEQCGTLTVPTLAEPQPLVAFLASVPRGSLVVADEAIAGAAMDPIEAIRRATPPLSVLVGPEGGFSDKERALFGADAIKVSLGPRILRADTAAVALLALVEVAHPSVA
ncbi:MAG: 16S rRNA (uracil(1498)-N(3))-methyltransferase [Pseudomonadota bacterium]